MLNFRLKVNLPGKIEAMIRLSSSFVPRILSIKKNKLDLKQKKDEIIQLDIIRKNQELAYILLINQKCYEKLVTAYNIYNLD